MPWQWHIYDYWISPPRAAKSDPDRDDRQHFQQGTWVGIVEGRAVTFFVLLLRTRRHGGPGRRIALGDIAASKVLSLRQARC